MAAAGASASILASNSQTPQVVKTAYVPLKPSHLRTIPSSQMFLSSILQCKMELQYHRRRKVLTLCFAKENQNKIARVEKTNGGGSGGGNEEASGNTIIATVVLFSVMSMAIMLSVYYRFTLQMKSGDASMTEILSTIAMSVGAAVGMEFWSRWVHKALWHASLRCIHETHHRPREGTFELNDVFAFLNAIPAVALISYGFFNQGLVPSLCFGAGTGVTLIGIAYVLVHDGLVHERFPVGPLANVPYFREVADAHRIHHTKKFKGMPYGFFLGPKELEQVGGLDSKVDTF